MRFLYFLALLIFSSSALVAQIEIAPITANPTLQVQQKKDSKSIDEEEAVTRMMTNDCPDPIQVDTTFAESTTLYIESGTTYIICIDQLAFNVLQSVTCLNCDDLNFGTVSPGATDLCFYYAADAGIIAETGDVMILEACDLDGCENIEFPIVVKRANNSVTQPTTSIGIESTIQLCLPFINLPGTERNYAYKGCNDPLLGSLTAADNCVDFTSKRFGEPNEVCIEVCDENCICDTYVFPIEINAPTIALPFYDDFSYDGPFPDKNLWLDDNVYVNNHMAYQPPSYGVATFDGLNQQGTPYGGRGAADYLTSGYMDLEGMTADSNVYLSYYIQPKGISNFFPLPQDSLVLQFMTDTAGWETVALYNGLSASTSLLERIPFTTMEIVDTTTATGMRTVSSLRTHHIRLARFLHDHFQFRFVNYCKRSGMNYLWHLDYVRLVKNEITTNGSFADIALTDIPSPFLKTFRHMPWKHFKGFESNELGQEIAISLYNQDGRTAEGAIPVSDLEIRDLSNNSIIFSKEEILLTELDPGSGGINQRNPNFDVHYLFKNPFNFQSIAGYSPSNTDNLIYETSYIFAPSGQNDLAKRNDQASSRTIFSNYFAYDDGTPEAMVTTNNINTQLATQFHANIADTLRGVQINFPYTGTSLTGEFIINVWTGDINTEPIYTSPNYTVIQAEQFFDTLNAFSSYPLLSENFEEMGVALPPGDFYVGVQLVSSGNFGVGYDLNSTDAGDFQLFKVAGTNSTWDTLIQAGALMIRPVVGDEFPVTTNTENPKVEQSLQVKIFPNPAQELIHLPVNTENTANLQVQVVSSTGQVLWDRPWESTMELNNWSNGLYFIWIRDKETGVQVKEKFLILR